jgi:hypothetical protein
VTCQNFQRQLRWLVEMKQQPGWVAYADWKVKKMDEGASGLYRGIAQALTDEMIKMKAGK